MSIKVGNKTILRYTLKDQDAVAIDISGASSKSIVVKSPYGTAYSPTVSFTTDGTDGQLEGRFTQPAPAGIWKAEVYLTGVDGFDGASETDQFPVEPRL